jgi:hypothetical protein
MLFDHYKIDSVIEFDFNKMSITSRTLFLSIASLSNMQNLLFLHEILNYNLRYEAGIWRLVGQLVFLNLPNLLFADNFTGLLEIFKCIYEDFANTSFFSPLLLEVYKYEENFDSEIYDDI